MIEKLPVGCRVEADTPASRFYLLFCKALGLSEVPEADDADPEFWQVICDMGVVAWNISFEEGSAGQLIDSFADEYFLSMPPSFRAVMNSMIEDRRAAFANESCRIRSCCAQWPDLVIEY